MKRGTAMKPRPSTIVLNIISITCLVLVFAIPTAAKIAGVL